MTRFAALLFASLLAACSGSGDAPAPAPEPAPAAESAPADAALDQALKIAAQLRAEPGRAEAILADAGMTVDVWENLMADIAADPARAAAFDSKLR